MKRFITLLQQQISGIVVLALVIASIGFTPITPTLETQKAHALGFGGGPVTVVGGTGTIQDTISAGANTTVAGIQTALSIKELSLDPIAHALAKMLLKSMTQSILNWINSGFQGSPAFVTDLKQFLLDQADALVGDFIYNDPALNFLCSPFQLDVKVALSTTYQEKTHEGFGNEAQCTLTGVTENIESFLAGDSFDPQNWFEVTQNPTNTPTGAYLAAEGEMYARIADAEGNTVNELEWGQGFLSFKVCSDTDVATGAQTDCDITTPGQVIADQVNKSLGAGQDALIEADEINEIIGAFFAQLAQQAITGINGLLGLSQPGSGSGSPAESVSPCGTTGSYLDELCDEGSEAGSVNNPIKDAVKREQEHIALQKKIVAMIDGAEATLNAAKELYENCVTGTLPANLTNKRKKANEAIITSEEVLPELIKLRDKFNTSTDPQEQLAIVETYNGLKSSGLVVDYTSNYSLEVEVNYTIKKQVNDFLKDLEFKKMLCNDDDD